MRVHVCAHARVCVLCVATAIDAKHWRDGEVVADWKDSEVVSVPKKGDSQNCDNWRGISLLDVVGKLFA